MFFIIICILLISVSALARKINPPDQETLQKILADFEAYAEQSRKTGVSQEWLYPSSKG